MITKIYGVIEGFSLRGVNVRIGGFVYEVLLTAADKEIVEGRSIGSELSLYTLFFIEGGGFAGGSHSPALVGFLNPRDREFFELFISVEGIGVGSALKMLSVPVPRVAQAIEDNNLRFLCTLKLVGDRTARKIVASLMGKVKAYAQEDLPGEESKEGAAPRCTGTTTSASEVTGTDRASVQPVNAQLHQEQLKDQAAEILEQLGYSSGEVKRMLARVLENRTDFKEVRDILNAIYQ